MTETFSDKAPRRQSLYELSVQYEQAARLQQEAIAHTRRRYNALANKHGSREGYRLYRLLQVLYAQRRELLQTSVYLRQYYRFSTHTE